jgi:enamine deaminase RidA (YjgF/YER057c/UK114 family)
MRNAIYIPGFAHTNPVPAACRKGPLVVSGGISGQDPESGRLPKTLDEQCSNVFRHLRAVMDAAGSSVADIVKVTVWLADTSDREALNREWIAMFPDAADRPTRHVQRGELPAGVLIAADLLAFTEMA